MERWRNFFSRGNADIWTIIEKAIIVAAVYHPEDFKKKRGEIAETLFSRTLVDELANRSVEILSQKGHDEFLLLEEGELRDEKGIGKGREANKTAEAEEKEGRMCFDAVKDDDPCSNPDEESLLRQKIEKIRQIIEDETQPERVLLAALQNLENINITVNALKVTEIGRQVNNLRKHSSKQVRVIVKRLVKYWKLLVDQWVTVGEDQHAGASAITLSECRDVPKATNPVKALSHFSSPSTGGAITCSSEVSQLLSFVDGGLQERTKSSEVEAPINGSFYGSSRSQSAVMRTDSSDCDVKLSNGLGTPGEMGSATRDNYSSGSTEKVCKSFVRESINWHDTGLRHISGLPLVKPSTSARPSGESKVVLMYRSVVKERPIRGLPNINRRHTSDIDGSGDHVNSRSSMDKNGFQKVEKSQVDQKLEVAKRKLHEGYQQAESAKKQRTVQVLDFPDLPKTEARGKTNPSMHDRGGVYGNYGGQNRRCG